MWLLIWDGTVRGWLSWGDSCIIGSGQCADITILNEPTISREHLRITVEEYSSSHFPILSIYDSSKWGTVVSPFDPPHHTSESHERELPNWVYPRWVWKTIVKQAASPLLRPIPAEVLSPGVISHHSSGAVGIRQAGPCHLSPPLPPAELSSAFSSAESASPSSTSFGVATPLVAVHVGLHVNPLWLMWWPIWVLLDGPLPSSSEMVRKFLNGIGGVSIELSEAIHLQETHPGSLLRVSDSEKCEVVVEDFDQLPLPWMISFTAIVLPSPITMCCLGWGVPIIHWAFYDSWISAHHWLSPPPSFAHFSPSCFPPLDIFWSQCSSSLSSSSSPTLISSTSLSFKYFYPSYQRRCLFKNHQFITFDLGVYEYGREVIRACGGTLTLDTHLGISGPLKQGKRPTWRDLGSFAASHPNALLLFCKKGMLPLERMAFTGEEGKEWFSEKDENVIRALSQEYHMTHVGLDQLCWSILHLQPLQSSIQSISDDSTYSLPEELSSASDQESRAPSQVLHASFQQPPVTTSLSRSVEVLPVFPHELGPLPALNSPSSAVSGNSWHFPRNRGCGDNSREELISKSVNSSKISLSREGTNKSPRQPDLPLSHSSVASILFPLQKKITFKKQKCLISSRRIHCVLPSFLPTSNENQKKEVNGKKNPSSLSSSSGTGGGEIAWGDEAMALLYDDHIIPDHDPEPLSSEASWNKFDSIEHHRQAHSQIKKAKTRASLSITLLEQSSVSLTSGGRQVKRGRKNKQ